MRFPLRALLAATALATLLLWTSPAVAQKGKPQPPPEEPPPPPPHASEVVVYRPDLGGWLDTSTNLVWGYMLTKTRGTSASFEWGKGFAANYAEEMWIAGEEREAYADFAAAKAIELQESDPERAAIYAQRAEDYYYSADVCYDTATAAAQYTGWRTPTLTEATDAVAKELFIYGSDPVHYPDGWQTMPDLPPYQSWSDTLTWTSSSAGKVKGQNVAWAFYPVSGGTAKIGMNSAVHVVVVRTHVP